MAQRNVFPGRLALYRGLSGMTQKELSAASGVSVPQIARYERGESSPRMASVAKLAHALGIKPNELIEAQEAGVVGVRVEISHEDGESSLTSSISSDIADRLRLIANEEGWHQPTYQLALVMIGCSDPSNQSDESLRAIYKAATLPFSM